MNQENSSTLSKYARYFFSGTLLSRISGMVRDIVMAATFGDHPAVATFMVAFRFSHFLRRLLGEGTLQSIFIPHYEELKAQDEKKAEGFFFQLYILLSTLLVGIIAIVEIGILPWKTLEIMPLFAWMFPSLFFISLYGLNLSLLQCKRAFFSSSIAPLCCNAVWIIGMLYLAKKPPSEAMLSLSGCILLGFALQWLCTLPKTWKVLKNGKKSSSSLLCIPSEVRSLGKATFFGMVGVAAMQINSFLDMLFAKWADPKGPIYLWYAIRLEQLPLAVVGFACVYSITPSIARAIKTGATDTAHSLFSFGQKRILLFIIPCTFAIFALGFSSIDLLFGRGLFSLEATQKTNYCLAAYALSLLPSLLTIYQSSLFYAYGNTKTPMIISIFSIVFHIVCNSVLIFGFQLGAISIALSTSLSAWLNYFLLHKSFTKKQYWEYPATTSGVFGKICLISALACSISLTTQSLIPLVRSSTMSQLIYFASHASLFVITFALFLRVLYKKVFFDLKEMVLPQKASASKTM
jgi:putative peptidoglycan lipid II flippase